MIVSRNINWRHTFDYTWRGMLYFGLLSVLVYILHHEFDLRKISVPYSAVATISIALSIFLGFMNRSAYDRWWEARKIWGMLVNYSRAWGREVLTLSLVPDSAPCEELLAWRRRLIHRHIAFVHALRVLLRQPRDYNNIGKQWLQTSNDYDDIRPFLSHSEAEEVLSKRNPPNYLLMIQGREIQEAYERGWLSDYRFVRLSKTLTDFNDHQGMSERIKNTPFPRPYSYFSRVAVYLHGTLVPLAFIEELGMYNIPLSMLINVVFLALDQIGEQTEDPFENRPSDTPLTSISTTIEENLKEMLGDSDLPVKSKPVSGVVF